MEDVELVPEKEIIEDGKGGCPAFHCDFYDTEIVHKIAQLFVPGLAAACIDNTTGGIFRSPATVAVDLRKEMVDYLTQRSESFVAESVILEDGPDVEVSDHPYDIIAGFVDDFASSKRNFFSRVSGWLLSEKREENVDDFAQEMEMNGFWLMDRRESVAQTLVKNIDFKNIFHCDQKFNIEEELVEHVVDCGFRSVNCTNEGCTFVICASQVEKHDSQCPFKIIPCEQKCSDHIVRHQMDRHCITVCPMKLVNCPFYAVGCKSTIPRCVIQKHCSDDLQLHLVYALKNIHKGASEEDLKQRVDQIVQSSSGQLDATKDARSLTLRVRDLDAKLGPLEPNSAKKADEDSPKDANNCTDKSIETGAETTADEKSSVPENGGAEKPTKGANNNTDESTEARTENTEAAAENTADEKSSVAGNGGGEKPTNTTNNAGEELPDTESSNLTNPASKEVKTQVSTA